jgi:hypothetical protein
MTKSNDDLIICSKEIFKTEKATPKMGKKKWPQIKYLPKKDLMTDVSMSLTEST